MDIITNLVTSPLATSNQNADISMSFNQSALPQQSDESQVLDIPQGDDIIANGRALPQLGNNKPVILNFNMALKEEIEGQMPALDAEQTLIVQSENNIPVLDKEIEEFEIIEQVDIGFVQNNIASQTQFPIEANGLIQQDEKLASLINLPIQLKEITDPHSDVITMSVEESKQLTPVVGMIKDFYIDTSTESELDFDVDVEADKLTQAMSEPSPQSIEQVKTNISSEKEINLSILKEFKPTESVEDFNLSLNDKSPKQETKELSNTETMTSQYQAIAEQIAIRKNESSVPSNTPERVVSRENFSKDLTENIQLMINANDNSAQVDINPPELGKIEIKIVQEADKMHISFLASQQETQALIEASIDRLKTQVEMQGLNLGNVTVSHGDANQQEQLAKQQRSFARAQEEAGAVDNTLTVLQYQAPKSMLDLYA